MKRRTCRKRSSRCSVSLGRRAGGVGNVQSVWRGLRSENARDMDSPSRRGRHRGSATPPGKNTPAANALAVKKLNGYHSIQSINYIPAAVPNACASVFMCSGVVPQQPPMSDAPLSLQRSACLVYAAALITPSPVSALSCECSSYSLWSIGQAQVPAYREPEPAVRDTTGTETRGSEEHRDRRRESLDPGVFPRAVRCLLQPLACRTLENISVRPNRHPFTTAQESQSVRQPNWRSILLFKNGL